jgi:hypothetical protein
MIWCFPENIPSTGYSHFAISSSTQTKNREKVAQISVGYKSRIDQKLNLKLKKPRKEST